MSQQLLSLVNLYISSLGAALASSVDAGSKSDYRARLRAANEVRDALSSENIAGAASILSEEKYTIGHIGMHGPGSDDAHYHFTRLAESLTKFRLSNRPDAGFGH